MSSPEIAFPSILSTRCVDEFVSCVMCSSKPDVIGTCGHPMCWICAKSWLTNYRGRCPCNGCLSEPCRPWPRPNFLPLLKLQPSVKNLKNTILSGEQSKSVDSLLTKIKDLEQELLLTKQESYKMI